MQSLVKTLSRSGISAGLFLLFTLAALPAAASSPLAAQSNQAGGSNQAVSIPEFGVTIQVPAGWGHHQYANAHELLNLPPTAIQKPAVSEIENAARIHMGIIKLGSHSDAVARLSMVIAERPVQPTFLTIGGWPALQRQTLVVKPERGEQEGPNESSNRPRKMLILVTTAVAVGNSVFRMDGTVAAESQAANAIAEQIKEIGRGVSFAQTEDPALVERELQKLQSGASPSTTNSQAPNGASATLAQGATQTASSLAGLSVNTTLGGNGTEPEIAVSTSGRNIVIASQSGGVSSQDGGQTFSSSFGFQKTACGDSSLAFGRSGNFYEGSIGSNTQACDSQVLNISVDGGKTFKFGTNPFICTTSTCNFVGTANPNGVPDQEHIAADRFNAGPPPTAGDQVYFVWRNPNGYGISCSSDSGTTWSAAQFKGDGSADFPRITVGQDGTVYVVYLNGGNIELDTYTSCANGLTQQHQGLVAVAGTNAVDCPVAGLDRCGGNGGTGQNDLRSHMLAVDDTNASHVYVAYATNDVPGVNEDVFVADSPDNGVTWSIPVQVNNSIPGRRFLPWVCSVGGAAYVSWYDRRNATSITNDATDYFGGSVAPSGGALTPTPDFQINASSTSDPQCGIAKGGFWPAPAAAASYSTSCYVQPQFAGVCGTANPPPPGDITAQCDFATGLTPAGTGCPTGSNGAETCQIGRGQPKYGDYNGNSCQAGRFYTVFGSATPQPSTNPPVGINLFFSQQLVCCAPQIQVPGPVSLTACSGSTATATANICNTGKADLQISAISSSNPEITVATPSSGYPLVVSADSCFPAQVSLSPGGATGAISGTLTISSNDTVNPSATVQINGNSPPPSINATIVNSGNFGSVCPAGQSNLNLQITNQGQCNLVVNAVTSSSSNFLLPSTSLPLTLSADASVNLPISFQPSASQSCSNTNPLSGLISVFSNDPVTSPLTASVRGIVPCPSINATIANGGSFGNVCAGNQGGSTLQVLNTGQCNLNISSITSSNPSGFVLPTVSSFPLVLSADANANLPITFVPSGVCSNTTPQSSIITIVSNDPAHSSLTEPVSGIEGCPKLTLSPQNLSGAFAYPATVSDPTGNLGCYTDKQITVGNSGICPLNITSLATMNGLDGLGHALPASPLEFNVVSPTVPISIGPGAAPVPITVRFKPVILTDQNAAAPDQQTGTLTIVSNDPVSADNAAGLCGEPTYHSGARVLVVNGTGTPINPVKSLSLSSKGLHPDLSETLAPAPLGLASVCGNNILYQLDNETLPPAGTTGSNPKSSYEISAKQGATQASMSFTLGQCQMQQLVLQIK